MDIKVSFLITLKSTLWQSKYKEVKIIINVNDEYNFVICNIPSAQFSKILKNGKLAMHFVFPITMKITL